jgi:hypothetical protein
VAYDQQLADRIERLLVTHTPVTTRRMFGGLAFLVDGHMCCGVVGSELMARVGPDAYRRALAEEHARPMDFTGRPMRGFVFVAEPGIRDEEALGAWLERCVDFVRSLPPKPGSK